MRRNNLLKIVVFFLISILLCACINKKIEISNQITGELYFEEKIKKVQWKVVNWWEFFTFCLQSFTCWTFLRSSRFWKINFNNRFQTVVWTWNRSFLFFFEFYHRNSYNCLTMILWAFRFVFLGQSHFDILYVTVSSSFFSLRVVKVEQIRE